MEGNEKEVEESNKTSSRTEEDDSFITQVELGYENSKENEILRKSTKRTVELVPPDGGWGWMVVLGGFLSMVLGTFPLFSFSILFSPLLMASGVSSLTVTWIYNLYGLTWSIYAPFIGPLCEEYGWRRVAIFGGISNFLAIFLSAFAPKAELLFLTFSFLGGIGGCTGFTVCNLAASRYFLKRRGFALAIISIGGPASSFCGPLVVNCLLEYYGYMGSTLICAAFVLNQCVGGALYQPVKRHMKLTKQNPTSENSIKEELLKEFQEIDSVKLKQEKQSLHENTAFSNVIHSTDSVEHSVRDNLAFSGKLVHKSNDSKQRKSIWGQINKISKLTLVNIKTLRFFRVKIIAVGHSCLLLGFHNFQMWIPFLVTNAGYSLEVSVWCISIASLANITGRVLMSFLSDRKWFNIRYGYMFGLFSSGISVIVFAFAKNMELFMASVCFWGLGIGISASLYATVNIHLMGIELLPAVFGVSSLMKGLVGIVYGPLVGFIRDATSSYSLAVCLLAGAELFGFGLWFLMPLAVKYDQKKLQKEVEPL